MDHSDSFAQLKTQMESLTLQADAISALALFTPEPTYCTQTSHLGTSSLAAL